MAKDYRQLMESIEQGLDNKEGLQTASFLPEDTSLPGEEPPSALIRQLQELIQEEKVTSVQMSQLLSELQSTLEELHHLSPDASDAAFGDAKRRVAEEAARSVRETAQESMRLIKALERESRARIERLALLTIPDRALAIVRWAVLLLAMFLLAHAVWGVLAP